MLKHATICRTSKAQQAFSSQCQWGPQQQQAAEHQAPSEAVSSELVASDQIGGRDHRNCLDSTKFVSSSCSASPTPSSQLHQTKTNLFSLYAAPPSFCNSPSKHDNQQTNGSSHRRASRSVPTNKSSESTIKIYAQTLSQDVEYVTLHVSAQTKSQQIIRSLLKKFRLKHRDPNLFYLTLERWIRKDGLRVKSVMLLSDEACPLQLQQCCSNPPHNDIKFTLQIRSGALMKIYCSDVCSQSRYKCLSLSTHTTVDETIELMLHCLNLHTIQMNDHSSHQELNQHTQTEQRIESRRQANSPGGVSSDSSASSQSSSSSSSGIESDPTNQPLQITTSPKKLNSNSRTSSITSISSSSNISNNSYLLTSDTLNTIVDQYCLVIECKNTNYRRVLGSDEYLVDVFQNLVEEARQGGSSLKFSTGPLSSSLNENNKLDLFNVSSTSTNASLLSNLSSSSIGGELVKQTVDQWFVIKLKRRDTISPHHLDLIRSTNPHKQMVPLPPIPQSLSLPFNNANELKHIVSTAQIEVNTRPSSSLSSTVATNSNNAHRQATSTKATMSNSMISQQHTVDSCSYDVPDAGQQEPTAHGLPSVSPIQPSVVQHPTVATTSTSESGFAYQLATGSGTINPLVASATDDSQVLYGNVQQIRQHHSRQMSATCSSGDAHRMPPPPASLIWLPPIKPRRRNLSNASSTFRRSAATTTRESGLKMTNSFTCNRRRYDPVQLAKDLNELNLNDSGVAAPKSTTSINDQQPVT